MYNKALTPAELITDMATTVTSGTANLKAAWNFNEGTGTTLADVMTINPVTITGTGATWLSITPSAPSAITMTSTISKSVGDADFSPASSTTSGIQYSSSNTAVSTVVNNSIHVVASGTSTITASQPANLFYTAGTDVTSTLTVLKANVITFPTIPLTYAGVADFSPNGTASSGLAVTYTSSNEAVATIVSDQIHIVGPGTSTITASQSGNGTFTAATPVAKTLTVFALSTSSVENWHYIQFSNGSNVIADQGAGTNLRTAAKVSGTAAQLWKLEEVSAGSNTYYLTSILGNKMNFASGRFTSNAIAGVSVAFDVSSHSSYPASFELRQSTTAANGNHMNQWGGTELGNELGEWKYGDQNNPLKLLATTSSKEVLQARITAANAALNNTTAGNNAGQYTTYTRSVLQTAITTAQEVYDNVASVEANWLSASNTLKTAISTYYASVNAVTYSTTGSPVYYYVKNINQTKYISTIGVAEGGNVKCTVKDGRSTGEFWIFQLTGTGNNVKIISAQQPTLALQATSASSYVNLVPIASATEFTTMKNGNNFVIVPQGISSYVNIENANNKLVMYSFQNDDNGQWNFEDAVSSYTSTRTSARTLYNVAVTVGSDFGQFPQTSRTTFDGIIAAEEAKTPASMSNADLMTGILTLNTAIATYRASQLSNTSLLISSAAAPKWYYIRNYNYPTKVITANGVATDGTGGLICQIKNMQTVIDGSELWRFEYNATQTGFKVINKKTGMAIYHPGSASNPNLLKATASASDFVTGRTASFFPAFYIGIIGAGTYGYMHCDGQSNLVGWSTDGAATSWHIEAYIPTIATDGEWTTPSSWDTGTVPTSTTPVVINAAITINNDNVTSRSITINSGKSLTVAPGKQLTVSDTFTNNGILVLQSDATSGTATVTGNVSGNATVEQYLPAATERTWWYLASPVTGAASEVFGSNQVGSYSEATRSYSQPFTAAETLEAGKGYVVKMNASEAATYQFANKVLNNGDISVPLTRSVTGTLDNKRGFNLVGNPYPSYLNWEMAYNASTNVRSTIWYRTKGTSAMEFHTYNAALGVSVPTAASGYIPPMQAFWVKVDTDPVSPATESTGTLNFTNDMRGHANSSENRLKAPAANSLPLLRMALSNGSTSDETVIALHENASANFDQYDSEKMSNTGTSEVFTLAGTQELTINAQPDSEGSKLIPLGIRPANAGSLNLSVSELKNLDNMQIILHDNVLKTETQLSLNQSYHFTTDGTATNNRFSVEFRAPGMTTGLDNSDFTDFNITVYSGKIQIQSPAMANGELIRVYSSNGQKIIEQTAKGSNTIIDHKLSSGVYFVKVSNYVQKIIIQ
jgi:hypothetical protein